MYGCVCVCVTVPPRIVPIFKVAPLTIRPCTCAIPVPVDGFNVPVNEDSHPQQLVCVGGLTQVQLMHTQFDAEVANMFAHRLQTFRRGPFDGVYTG